MKTIFSFLKQVAMVTFLALVACDKDQEPGIPTVDIITPYENEIFHVGDTIRISATISNDKIIENVKVALTDSSLQPVLPAAFYYPGSASFQLETNYIIHDNALPSSAYYLLVKADNGTNFKNKYRKIYIEGIAREFEKLVAITRKNSNLMQVMAFEGSQSSTLLFEITGDFADSEISSRYRQLYVAGKNHIHLNTYDIDHFELEWFLPVAPPLPLHANHCLHFDEFIFTSYYSFYIKGFRPNGQEGFNTLTIDPELPSRIFRHEGLIIADLQNKSGGDTFVATYYLVSGTEKQRIYTNFRVVDFYTENDDRVLTVANRFDESVLKIYNPYLNEFTDLTTFGQKIISSVQVEAHLFLIGFEDTVLLYNSTQNTYTEVLSDMKAYCMRYDDLNSKIVIGSANAVSVFSYPAFLFQSYHSVSDTLLNIHLLYNK